MLIVLVIPEVTCDFYDFVVQKARKTESPAEVLLYVEKNNQFVRVRRITVATEVSLVQQCFSKLCSV